MYIFLSKCPYIETHIYISDEIYILELYYPRLSVCNGVCPTLEWQKLNIHFILFFIQKGASLWWCLQWMRVTRTIHWLSLSQAAAGGIGQHIIACTFCICFVSSELYFGFCYFVSGITSQVYNKFMHLKAKICIGTARWQHGWRWQWVSGWSLSIFGVAEAVNLCSFPADFLLITAVSTFARWSGLFFRQPYWGLRSKQWDHCQFPTHTMAGHRSLVYINDCVSCRRFFLRKTEDGVKKK